jgi:hypothetical protein
MGLSPKKKNIYYVTYYPEGVVGQFDFSCSCHVVGLHFIYCSFCRIHQSLRITPAMAAGVANHVWDIRDLISLMK